MVEDITLLEYLYKLAVVRSEEEIENLLLLLWRTRKIGLSASQKSSIQSLLKLPLSGDVDPILAALRLVIRTCVHKNLVGDDALKLFPPDFPLELQSMLIILLQKHQNHWKKEQSQDQHVSRFSHHVDVGLSTPLIPFSSSVVSGSFLPLHVNPNSHFNGPKLGPTPVLAESHVCFPQANLQNDAPPEIPGVLPRVKSMTWTVENRSEMPTHRVSIITLKLQDYTKSPSNETEVKFLLTRDTLEAVLRSMTYINEQLSRFVRSSSVPLLKKPRQ